MAVFSFGITRESARKGCGPIRFVLALVGAGVGGRRGCCRHASPQVRPWNAAVGSGLHGVASGGGTGWPQPLNQSLLKRILPGWQLVTVIFRRAIMTLVRTDVIILRNDVGWTPSENCFLRVHLYRVFKGRIFKLCVYSTHLLIFLFEILITNYWSCPLSELALV